MAKEKTRCGGRWTEAKFMAFVRSSLRSASRRWAPIHDALIAARRKNQSPNKRLKWEFQCRKCGNWFPNKQVKVDHIVPVGSLTLDDAGKFLERLFVEIDGLQVLCEGCHDIKTATERLERRCGSDVKVLEPEKPCGVHAERAPRGKKRRTNCPGI